MSVFDAFFNMGFFRASKCKTLLKLTIPRIKLLRNRREMQLKQMRRDIAMLLQNGQEATARIRVEHIIREENMMAAQEILELFCELIAVRLPIIEAQRECPLDLKEAISTICFAAPRCADLPELQQVQMLFAAKYGKEFAAAASELLPDCGVNRRVIELLSVRAPAVEGKLKLLKEIAEEHDVDWDPAATESEFFKPHEDLLNGPSAFVGASTLPLPHEKYTEQSTPEKAVEEELKDVPDSDLDSWDLPEVPKASVNASPSVGVGPDSIDPSFPTMPPSESRSPDGIPISDDVCQDTPPTTTVGVKEQPKQFVPFVTLPASVTPPSPGIPHNTVPSSIPSPSSTPSPFTQVGTQMEQDHSLGDELACAKEQDHSLGDELACAKEVEVAEFVERTASPTATASHSQAPPAISTPEVKGAAEADETYLNEVLTATRVAADTAERAAAAAREAANLARLKITEFALKKNGKLAENPGAENVLSSPSQTGSSERFATEEQYLPENRSPTSLQHESPNLKPESQHSTSFQPIPQTSRSSSLEDDPYFSYPNLFSRQNSDLRSSKDGSP